MTKIVTKTGRTFYCHAVNERVLVACAARVGAIDGRKFEAVRLGVGCAHEARATELQDVVDEAAEGTA